MTGLHMSSWFHILNGENKNRETLGFIDINNTNEQLQTTKNKIIGHMTTRPWYIYTEDTIHFFDRFLALLSKDELVAIKTHHCDIRSHDDTREHVHTFIDKEIKKRNSHSFSFL